MSDIVPEDFDLEKQRHARSTTPRDQRKRCPECSSTFIDSSGGLWRESSHDYRCNKCGHTFDEPAVGEA